MKSHLRARLTLPILLAMFAVPLEAPTAKAASAKAQSLSVEEKFQIANAINELILTGTLASVVNKCVQFDPAREQSFGVEERRQITSAIEELIDTGTLMSEPNKCLQFDPDIIQMLMNEGLLKQKDSVLSSVCEGMQSH